jgi:predicted DNA-binding protein (MmcQ/YjbR family)
MKYEWLDEFLLSKIGARKDYKAEWGWNRYLLKDKMFAAICTNKESKPIITLKLEPVDGDFLRTQFPDIVPGYYMNKDHWNSVFLEGNVPDEILMDMINKSHQLILNSFSKKIQSEITGDNLS